MVAACGGGTPAMPDAPSTSLGGDRFVETVSLPLRERDGMGDLGLPAPVGMLFLAVLLGFAGVALIVGLGPVEPSATVFIAAAGCVAASACTLAACAW